MARPKPKQPKYRSPCQCGQCPRLPANRPPTLQEWINYWGHDGWFSSEKVERLSVELYVHRYAVWVNTHGWRKPPGWTGGRVPLSKLRPKNGRLLPLQVRAATKRLIAERRRKRESQPEPDLE